MFVGSGISETTIGTTFSPGSLNLCNLIGICTTGRPSRLLVVKVGRGSC
jgi:hypothetical protein